MFVRKVGITLGGFCACVAQQKAGSVELDAGLDKQRRKAVAQIVEVDIRSADGSPRLVERLLDALLANRQR